MLIIIIGPSGVGKNSVIDVLIKKHPKLKYMKTVTTRSSRAQNDDAYIRVTKEEFDAMKKRGEFFEYENVHADIMYGTTFKALEEVAKGEENFIKDIDVHGALKISHFLKDKTKVVTVFLDAPDEVLKQRLQNRGETPEMIKARMSRYKMEREFKNQFDIVIDNLLLKDTVEKIENAIGIENLT